MSNTLEKLNEDRVNALLQSLLLEDREEIHAYINRKVNEKERSTTWGDYVIIGLTSGVTIGIILGFAILCANCQENNRRSQSDAEINRKVQELLSVKLVEERTQFEIRSEKYNSRMQEMQLRLDASKLENEELSEVKSLIEQYCNRRSSP